MSGFASQRVDVFARLSANMRGLGDERLANALTQTHPQAALRAALDALVVVAADEPQQ